MRFIWILPILALLAACTRKQPRITFDEWWNVDYAKTGCEMMARGGHPCVTDPKEEVRAFEMAIAGAFAADPACHRVSLTGVGVNPGASLDWQLMLDFYDSSQPQGWTLIHHPDLRTVSGKGTAKEIAHSICMVAAGHGGLVKN
jgi:hypothetical protein